jgi:hypothetical protein
MNIDAKRDSFSKCLLRFDGSIYIIFFLGYNELIFVINDGIQGAIPNGLSDNEFSISIGGQVELILDILESDSRIREIDSPYACLNYNLLESLHDIVDFISEVDGLVLLHNLLEGAQVSLNDRTHNHVVGIEGLLMTTLGEGISGGNFALQQLNQTSPLLYLNLEAMSSVIRSLTKSLIESREGILV